MGEGRQRRRQCQCLPSNVSAVENSGLCLVGAVDIFWVGWSVLAAGF